jgi:hypothetical protein
MVAQLLPMLEPVLNGTKASIVNYIGKDDKLFHGMDINVDIADLGPLLNLAMMGSGGSGAAPTGAPTPLTLKFTLRLTAIGADQTIEPVADAVEMGQ